MKVYAGTSGYSYKEWKGAFYPEKLPAKEMLGYYAGRLPAVEINNTFYRMPKTHVVEGWAAEVPESFRFSLKASMRITHRSRLKDAGESTEFMLGQFAAMGDRLGVILFQLPPNMKQDVERLVTFLELLPEDTRAAFEFRHDSWFEESTYDCLRARNCALVISEGEEEEREVVSTADWSYLRLRRSFYTDPELEEWAERIDAQDWNEAFVFFKHEDAGSGPRCAGQFLELFS